MPNWCTNRLEVNGFEDELNRFRTMVVGDNAPIVLESLVPEPKELLEEERSDWRARNWGTAWTLANHLDPVVTSVRATYYFESGWTPPIAWVSTVSMMFPLLQFTLAYHEMNQGCAGEICFSDGHLSFMTELDLSDLGELENFLEEKFSVTLEELGIN